MFGSPFGDGALVGFSLAFALLHALLYGFRRRSASSLWLAAFAGLYGFLVACFGLLAEPLGDPGPLRRLALSLVPILFLCVRGSLRALLGRVGTRRREGLFWGAGIAVAGLAWLLPAWTERAPVIDVFVVVVVLDALRILVGGLGEGRREARPVAGGLLALSLAALVEILGRSLGRPVPAFPFGVVLLFLSLALSLGRQIGAAERVEGELEAARGIQRQMVAAVEPALPGYEAAALMRPAEEVGGDYYDFLGEERDPLVVCGDATGHGLPAGILVTAAKGALLASEEQRPLATVLDRVSRAIRGLELRRMTFALTLVRLARDHLELASAGMPPPVVRRAAGGALEEIVLPAPPLGSPLRRGSYESRRVPFEPGDLALLFSDGVPEAARADGEPFGYERVHRFLAEHGAAARPLGEIVEGLAVEVSSWLAGREADDDITILAIRRRGSASGRSAG